MNKIIYTLIFVILSTYTILQFKNNSNISKFIIIPLIVAPLTKYIIGDWDEGYKYTINDIFYWVTIFTTINLILYFSK